MEKSHKELYVSPALMVVEVKTEQIVCQSPVDKLGDPNYNSWDNLTW